ncbi:hypothetical protein PIB30_042309 [Stylosanthes scabra]|uniref:Uncharacterized protein n=1 Tax=Stylosanthes scabra TaxID=79078 RepID=A0ABU6YE08_9FABA|nr:hypothetical protein [Stylosanthes scabra]
MVRNRITIQQLLAMKWKSHDQVSDHTAALTFVLIDGEAKKLLGTSASNLMTSQQGIDTEAPSQLQNLCNLTLIFEVRVNDYNLKEDRKTTPSQRHLSRPESQKNNQYSIT